MRKSLCRLAILTSLTLIPSSCVRVNDTEKTYGGSVVSCVPDALVGKWGFNGDAKDDKGKINGRIEGEPVYVMDRFENKDSALFLKKGQCVDFGNSEALSFTNGTKDKPFTIAWWQKCDVPEAESGFSLAPVGILEKAGEYSIGWSNAFRLGLKDGAGVAGRSSSIRLNSQNWTHVAVVYDGTGSPSGIQLYQDGKLCPSQAESSANEHYAHMKRTGSLLVFGGSYAGAVDDLVIYGRVLAAEEIRELRDPSLGGVSRQEENLNFHAYNADKPNKGNVISIPFVAEAPGMDGRFADAAWKTAKWYKLEHGIGSAKMANETKFAIVHDQENIYFAVECAELAPGKIKAAQTARDGDVWTDDSVEFFIDTGFGGRTPMHYHLAANTKDVVFDELAIRGSKISNRTWDSMARVRTEVGEGAWRLEAAIPFAGMKFALNNPEYLRINVFRTRMAGENREIASFSPVANGHDSAKFAFAVVDNFPREFALLDSSLKRTDVLSEDGQLLAVCDLAFHNASQTPKQVELSLELIGDNPTQVSVPLTLQPGMMERRVPMALKKCGKSSLKLSVMDAATGELLSFAYYEVDLKYAPLRVTVLRPRYKNAIFSNQDIKELVLGVETSVGDKDRAFCEIEFTLTDPAGRTVTTKRAEVAGKAQDEFIVPMPELADGDYAMRMKLIHRKAHTVLGEWESCLRKLQHKKGQCNVNNAGMLLVDNKPFVPFGMATFGTACSLIWESSEFGCNTIHTLARLTDEHLPFLDATARADMKVIVYGVPSSITVPCFNNKKGVSDRPLTGQERQELSDYINKYKEQVSILSWYTANEPAEPNVSPEIMGDIDGIASACDPYHPTACIINSIAALPVFSKYSDIVMADPYPVMREAGGWYFPNGPGNTVADARKYSLGMKPVWVVLESFDWRLWGGLQGKNRCPDFNDMRCQFFQVVAAGATGFFWYCRPWITPDTEIGLKYLAKETKALQGAILAPQSGKMFKSLESCENGEGASLHLSRRDLAGQTYFFTAESSLTPQKHTFKADLQAEALHVAGESRDVRVKDGVFIDTFVPYGTHLYTTDEKVAKILDREMAQTLKDIDLCNNPKAKPGNLACAANGTRITAETPIPTGNGVGMPPWEYMIDSNKFSWSSPKFSWSAPGNENKFPDWVQLIFDKAQDISTVVIDSNIDEVEIQILKDGKWQTVKGSKATGNSYRGTQTIKFAPVTAKELRIVAKSANGFAGLKESRIMIWEIEAYSL